MADTTVAQRPTSLCVADSRDQCVSDTTFYFIPKWLTEKRVSKWGLASVEK